MSRRPTARRLAPEVLLLVALLPGAAARADDTDLFRTNVPPNVLLLQDNSGSMNHIVWHPAYDPTVTPTCTPASSGYSNSAYYTFTANSTKTKCGRSRTIYVDPALGSTPTRYEGHYLNWLFSAATDAVGTSGSSIWQEIQSTTNGSNPSCAVTLGAPATYGKYRRSRIIAARDVLRNTICEVNARTKVRFGLAQFRQSGSSNDPNGGYVLVPIKDYTWDHDNNPSTPEIDFTYALNGATKTHANHLKDAITALDGETWTPLGESMFQLYTYFMSRTAANIPLGQDGVTKFPAYQYATSETNGGGAHSSAGAPTVPDSPAQYACQKTFVILITDGEPTKDDFDISNPGWPNTALGFSNFASLIGDYNPDNATAPENGGSEVQGDLFCSGCESATYLDDIAKFMHENDFRPDLAGVQTIDVYTVGFTTGDAANAMLHKTAEVGGGRFYSSNNPDQLDDAIVDAITDILEKAQSFTSATVPASRTTDGNNFYSSYFRPKKDSPFWDGHLKSFDFSANGDILTADGHCAVGTDASATPPCPTNAVLRTTASAFWDAGEQVPDPASRRLFVGLGATAFGAQAVGWSLSLAAADLDLGGVASLVPAALQASPFLLADPTNVSQQEGLADVLVSNLAGCTYGTLLGSSCVTRTNEDGSPNLLSDIFHSNPVVLGSPNSPLNQASYRAFASAFRTRNRVIYAGANDGFLHGFLAGQWDSGLVPPRHDRGTGAEVMAFLPSWVRERIWRLPASQTAGGGRSFYGVDGSPVAADVWLYRSVNSSTGALEGLLSPAIATSKLMQQWRTVLIGSLRDGGQSYFALDVTDPSGSTYAYPGYLWEFPCDDCSNAVNGSTFTEKEYMGFSWSEPVITRVRVKVEGDSTPGGHERWVAIFGAGYHPWSDPNDPAYVAPSDPAPVPTAQQQYDGYVSPKQGRALYMVDITTGQLLAAKRFEASSVVCSSSPVPAECEMKYAIASQPAVFDLDSDGFADVVYVGDLGGNLFKWVVKAVGDDPINNTSSDKDVSQPDWPFGVFFRANHSGADQANPSYGSDHFNSFFFPPTGAKRYGELRLAIGAGERAAPEAGLEDGDDSNNNHFYVLRDSDPFEHEYGAILTHVESDLVDNAALDSSPTNCADIGSKGFFLTARDREKFITNSVIFFGEVFTGSFLPAAAGADPCSATGSSYLYRFALDCGEGAYPSNPGSGNDRRRKAVGGGLPTRPRVSVGGLNQGGASGGCDNKVIVITSDGNIENDCPAPLPSSGIDIRTWRER